MLRFFKEHKGIVGYGMLLTFFSSFGQTFLISLFVPFFMSSFGFSNTAFGSIYATVTLASALALIYLGKLADQHSTKKYSFFVVFLLSVSMIVTTSAIHPLVFFIGLWGMRLAGQGLLPHTSATVMSRYFDKDRGKSLSISALGHSLGESLFPLLIILLISLFGWRITLSMGALLVIIVMLPYVFFIINFKRYDTAPEKNNVQEKKWTQFDVLKSKAFLFIAPSAFILTFLTTALLLYQIPLAQSKGWTAEWMAFCIIGFALARICFSLFSGVLVDKFGAKMIFPFYLVPFMIGLVILLTFTGAWAGYAYMFLMGVSVGLGGTIKSAIQAEVFGVASIGAVRSIFSTMVVFSTAVGPVLYGFLMDAGWSFNNLISLSIFLLLLVFLWSLKASDKHGLSFMLKPLFLLKFIKSK